VKRINNAAAFLLDTGLLGEINRLVLHPRGLSLEVIYNTNSSVPPHFGGLWDFRKDPEGLCFEDETIREAAMKLIAAEKDGRLPPSKEEVRLDVFGFHIQPAAHGLDD
jgi:hypothetical protein